MTHHRLTRRAILCACTGLLSQTAAAAQKKSKADVAYQSRSKSIYSCSACNFFRKPVSCAMVQGAVNPNGWCKLYSYPD